MSDRVHHRIKSIGRELTFEEWGQWCDEKRRNGTPNPVVYEFNGFQFNDNEAVTEAFLDAQTSNKEDVFYWADDKRYPFRDCPAIDNLPAPIMSSFGTISWVLPTLATMKDIASRIGDINAAIFAVGGIVVSPHYHWTCTVNKDYKESAFVVNSNNGNVNNNNMNNNNNVRAVSEFRELINNTIYPIDIEGMFVAYYDCRKGNSRSYCAQQFEAHYEHNIIELCREIRAGAYTPNEFRAFVITKPDYREIFAAQFRHRVVLHWIALRLAPQDDRNLAIAFAEKEVNVVIPDTIGQFTGLHDKNGKEVYEGDVLVICEYENMLKGVVCEAGEYELFTLDELKGELQQQYKSVIHYEDCTLFASEQDGCDIYLASLAGDMRKSYPIFEYEVIGNIHDNPELLNE